MVLGEFVPWMISPGLSNKSARVPSGLPGRPAAASKRLAAPALDAAAVEFGSAFPVLSGLIHASFTQPTPSQISKIETVTTDIPVDRTTTDDTVSTCTLYCWATTYAFAPVGIAERMIAAFDQNGSIATHK